MSFPTQMLQDLGTIYTGSTPKTNDESLFGGDIPFVTPGDLGEITPIHTATRSLTEEGAKTGTLLPAGAVLVCCIGSLGKIGFAGRPLVTNQQINAIVFDGKKIDPRYGFFACRLLKPQLESMAPATTVPIVNKSRFSELKIPVPPLKEQRRIAAILDQAETLRTQRRTALALLDSLTQSLFLDMFGDPVANPKGFTKQPLSEVAEITTGSTPGRGSDGYYGGNIPWIKTTEVTGGEIHDTEEKLTESGLKAIRGKLHPINSIVVAMYGQGQTRGRCALLRIEASCNQACGVVRPSEEFVPWFMFTQLLLAYERLRALGRGGNQENLNLQLLGSFEVLLPPLPLQQTFATRIASIEALKATHRRALAALDALFASLQQRAFAGQL